MSHVCGYTGDILLNPHLPDFTQDCVCPTLLQIRPRASVGKRENGQNTRTALWRVWREELFITAGELWSRGESSIQLHSLTAQGVSNKMFL